MNKDNYRDYTMDAFRFYSLCGKPSVQKIVWVRRKLPQMYQGDMEDLESVARLLERIRVVEPDDAEIWIKVIDRVFFRSPRQVPSRGVLSGRVRSLVEIGISESTAYRILRKVREMYAQERGLRRGEVHFEEICKALRG